ncbi:MAG TPA: M23 family metallopeptidase [Longimicrobiales bacterium]|nr:M23 family metallopeptidase [Longimicrobiales bacterium]
MKLSTLFLIGSLTLLSGCVRGERIGELRPSRGGTPRDAHALAAELTAAPAALQAWESASARALRAGLSIAPSFRERVRFPAGSPHAIAYRFTVARGQTLRVRVTPHGGGQIFADMFQAITSDMFRHVSTARSNALEFVAPVAGDYVLRLQPPLGAGGLFDVTVLAEAALLFPVAGAGLRDIGGGFGDPRDGGVRAHEGVDIFAPRGTPVLAVTAGRVSAVRNTPAGGRVVWLSDDARPLSYYYAHLDEQRVRSGARVQAGDTLGTVGTTGNAAGTPPHLHFGIYRPGTVAVDPSEFLHGVRAAAVVAEVRTDPLLLGQRVQVAGDRVRLRSSPSLEGSVLDELSASTTLLVLGAVGDWHRVVLDDGTSGFVSARFTVLQQPAMR